MRIICTRLKFLHYLCIASACCSRLSTAVCFDLRFADLGFLGVDFGLSNRLGCSNNLINKVRLILIKNLQCVLTYGNVLIYG